MCALRSDGVARVCGAVQLGVCGLMYIAAQKEVVGGAGK